MNEKLTKPYDPKETEPRIYKTWEDSGYFNPDNLPGDRKEPFTIIMPPPNVTGVLHMGHALGTTLQDIMIRYQRAQGKKTLFLPGTDHAAIATQSKVEKEIYKKEKKSRHDLGREELLRRVTEFAQDSHDSIVKQVKILGASCDWSREAFTLDETRSLAVRTAFKKMYEAGLIYRGFRVVNWDPKGQTTISDDEIVYEARQAKFYTFKYSKDFPIAISTTRPETKVGDVAVAVHPGDERYKEFIGQEFKDIDFCGVKINIKIIADDSVDPEFGTGALGVTPAHSMADADMAAKHNLEMIPVINEYAKITVGDERLLNKKTTEAREIIVEWLKEEGLLEKEEAIEQNVSTAERTGGIVEPLPKLQWFIDVNKPFTIPHSEITGIESGSQTTLKDIMRQTVASGDIKIIPARFEKTYFHWIDNLRDWCISRQIWYGHRLPVWYKEEEIYVDIEPPTGEGWKQDEDTLDTWFSSGLWTFSTLGWPEKTGDLEFYHPTDVLETGYDIIFFWNARMILMTGFALGQIPFKKAYFHGTVRDGQGRKMSKSLGNNTDPVDMADKYGADASRISLIIGNTPGNDMKLAEDKIKAYKHFANKLWNISRFILSNTENVTYDANFSNYTTTDQTLIEEKNNLITETTTDMEEYRFHLAAEKIYQYTWHRLADEILEESKDILNGEKEADKISRAQFLQNTLKDILVILHPFMPFITEEIWSFLPEQDKDLLIVKSWPKTLK